MMDKISAADPLKSGKSIKILSDPVESPGEAMAFTPSSRGAGRQVKGVFPPVPTLLQAVKNKFELMAAINEGLALVPV